MSTCVVRADAKAIHRRSCLERWGNEQTPHDSRDPADPEYSGKIKNEDTVYNQMGEGHEAANARARSAATRAGLTPEQARQFTRFLENEKRKLGQGGAYHDEDFLTEMLSLFLEKLGIGR